MFYAVSFNNGQRTSTHYFDTLSSAADYARYLPAFKSTVRMVWA